MVKLNTQVRLALAQIEQSALTEKGWALIKMITIEVNAIHENLNGKQPINLICTSIKKHLQSWKNNYPSHYSTVVLPSWLANEKISVKV